MNNIDINGNFIVCSLFKEQENIIKNGNILIYNKIDEGFQKINQFKIEKINIKDNIDFPFKENDIVIVASSGTIINLNKTKKWIFKPEHILAKINT